jgi:hypothetical protein
VLDNASLDLTRLQELIIESPSKISTGEPGSVGPCVEDRSCFNKNVVVLVCCGIKITRFTLGNLFKGGVVH